MNEQVLRPGGNCVKLGEWHFALDTRLETCTFTFSVLLTWAKALWSSSSFAPNWEMGRAIFSPLLGLLLCQQGNWIPEGWCWAFWLPGGWCRAGKLNTPPTCPPRKALHPVTSLLTFHAINLYTIIFSFFHLGKPDYSFQIGDKLLKLVLLSHGFLFEHSLGVGGSRALYSCSPSTCCFTGRCSKIPQRFLSIFNVGTTPRSVILSVVSPLGYTCLTRL